jgi:hypothetical protein
VTAVTIKANYGANFQNEASIITNTFISRDFGFGTISISHIISVLAILVDSCFKR